MDLGRVYLHRFRSERAALFLPGLPRGAVGHTRVRVAGRVRSPAHQGTAGADPSPGQGASSFAARGYLFSARQTGPGRGVLSGRPGAGSRGHRHALAPWPVPVAEKETGGGASAAGESVRRESEARLRVFADGFGGNASRFGPNGGCDCDLEKGAGRPFLRACAGSTGGALSAETGAATGPVRIERSRG